MSNTVRSGRTAVVALSAAGLSLAALAPGALRSGTTRDPVLAPVPAAATTAAKGAQEAQNWYLSLGDSLAAGYQPGRGDDKSGGYAGHVRDGIAKDVPGIALKNLGCSGEDTASMISGTRCSYPEGSQLGAAETFLRGKGQTVRLITIDLGANDVLPCSDGSGIDLQCLQKAMGAVNTNLPKILNRLRAAAPQARIVVLNYYNPFLAAWLTGASGQQLAKLSVGLQGSLNATVASAAKGVNASVADVAGAFDSTDWTETTSPLGRIPTNVATLCAQTWMCTKQDIHANDTGYATLGRVALRAAGALTPAPTEPPEPSSPSAPPSSSSPSPSPTSSEPSGPLVQTG